MASQPLFLVIGPPAGGKTTVAQMLAEIYGLRAGNCLDTVLDHLARNPAARRSLSATDVARATALLGQTSLTALADAQIDRGCRVLTGIGEQGHVEAIKAKYRRLDFSVTTIYVHRPSSQPKREAECDFPANAADVLITNNADLESLWCKVNGLVTPPPINVPGQRNAIIVRGKDPHERSERTTRLGGRLIDGSRRTAASEFEAAIDASARVIVVAAPFEALHEMKPFVEAARRSGAFIQVSEPSIPPEPPVKWQQGSLRDILASRTPKDKMAALKLILRSPPRSHADASLARIEEELCRNALYREELAELTQSGFFLGKEGPKSLYSLDPVSQDRSRVFAGHVIQSLSCAPAVLAMSR